MISQQVQKLFSSRLAVTFLNNLGPMLMDGPLYQKTALVLLNTREVGAVMQTQSFGDMEPDIAILTDSKGQKLPRPFQIQLRKDHSRQIVKILRGSRTPVYERVMGLEPTAYSLGSCHSTTELHPRVVSPDGFECFDHFDEVWRKNPSAGRFYAEDEDDPDTCH